MALTDPFSKHPKVLAKLPRLIRLYIFHSLIGFALAAVLTGLIISQNFAGIGRLVAQVEGGWLAAFVFFMLNGIVFAWVQTGIVIMSMGEDSGDQGGRCAELTPQATPIPVRASDSRA